MLASNQSVATDFCGSGSIWLLTQIQMSSFVFHQSKLSFGWIWIFVFRSMKPNSTVFC